MYLSLGKEEGVKKGFPIVLVLLPLSLKYGSPLGSQTMPHTVSQALAEEGSLLT